MSRRRRRKWLGIESIEEGDKIKWVCPSGVRGEAHVYKILGEALPSGFGLAVHFYSERVSHRSIDFHAFERAIPEEWITHWAGRRVRSSDPEIRPVDSSTDKGNGRQIEIPIQEGA